MVIPIGCEFPKLGQVYEFVDIRTGEEFAAEVLFIEIIGWKLTGEIGVELRMRVRKTEILQEGKKLPNLVLIKSE